MSLAEILTSLSAFLLGSGGVLAYMKAKSEIPAINVEAQSIIITNMKDELARVYEQNERLIASNQQQKKMLATLQAQLDELMGKS